MPGRKGVNVSAVVGSCSGEAEVGSVGQGEETSTQVLTREFALWLEPEDTRVEGRARVEVADGDGQVVDSGDVGHGLDLLSS